MQLIRSLFKRYSEAARIKRRAVFRDYFHIDEETKILDLGSEDGSNIANVLSGLAYGPQNVYIADIDQEVVKRGTDAYGFQPVVLREDARLPFEDRYFDIVYCSSVIEHVTVSKSEVWESLDTEAFRLRAKENQSLFASEIRRVGKGYFVQTPCQTFPLESHSWLPLVGILPRSAQVGFIRAANGVWVKKTIPDFYLLSESELKLMFPASEIVKEKSCGFTKSLMAIRAADGERE